MNNRMLEFLKQLREARTKIAFAEVYAALTDSEKLQAAIVANDPFSNSTTAPIPGLAEGAGTEQRNAIEWVEFLYSDKFIPAEHIRVNAPRILKYMRDAFGEGVIAKHGFKDEIFEITTDYDKNNLPKLREAILLYAAGSYVEGKFTKEDISLQSELQDLANEYAMTGNHEGSESIGPLNIMLKQTRCVITQSQALAGKLDELRDAAERVTRHNNPLFKREYNKNDVQLPDALIKSIIQTAKDLGDEIAKANRSKQGSLFGFFHQHKADTKSDKLAVLMNILKADNLKGVQAVVADVYANHADVLDGRTLTHINEIERYIETAKKPRAEGTPESPEPPRIR